MWVPAMANLLLLSLGLLEATQAQSLLFKQPDLFPQATPLDMAWASYDDQYIGCSPAMMAALPPLQKLELQANNVYARGWELGRRKWQELKARHPAWLRPLPMGFQEEHGVALMAYTLHGTLYKEFNDAVRLAGRSRTYYLQNFSFKSLHFLLTKALQLLRQNQWTPRCRQVYRGVAGLRFWPVVPRSPVRLGGFASASLRKDVAQQFGKDTFFSISTCLGVPIQHYSVFPGEQEVLIPPFETFRVISASRLPSGHVHIELQGQDKHSKYNCEYIKATA